MLGMLIGEIHVNRDAEANRTFRIYTDANRDCANEYESAYVPGFEIESTTLTTIDTFARVLCCICTLHCSHMTHK